MPQEGGDGLHRHAPVDGLNSKAVTQLVRVDVADAGLGGDGADPALDGIADQRALLTRQQATVIMDTVDSAVGVE